MALVIGLYRRDKGKFMHSTTTCSSQFLATQIGVINFDPATEPFALVMIVHDLRHHVFRLPGHVTNDTEVPRQLQGRETALTRVSKKMAGNQMVNGR
jgi:hypothetical protein